MKGASTIAPLVCAAGFAVSLAMFAIELGSFHRTVGEWAHRDLRAKAELAAANLAEPIATQDFRAIREIGSRMRDEGVLLSILGAGGGTVYASSGKNDAADDHIEETVRSGEWNVRLELSSARVYAPFRRARFGFLLAALAGAAGVLLVFFSSYRQRVRIAELKRQEKFRREFIADFSHELKTPLTGIMGAAEMLGEANGEMKEKLTEMIRRESGRLNTLAQGILDLSRLEQGREAIRRERLDLAELVRSLAERFGVKCAVGAAVIPFEADGQLVETAVTNLIVNAKRHSGTDDITVSVEADASKAAIAVEDHGIGVPESERERIFERFRRLDPSRAEASGGAGLGLAIVQRIARLHGGEARCLAAKPNGARFEIELKGKF